MVRWDALAGLVSGGRRSLLNKTVEEQVMLSYRRREETTFPSMALSLTALVTLVVHHFHSLITAPLDRQQLCPVHLCWPARSSQKGQVGGLGGLLARPAFHIYGSNPPHQGPHARFGARAEDGSHEC